MTVFVTTLLEKNRSLGTLPGFRDRRIKGTFDRSLVLRDPEVLGSKHESPHQRTHTRITSASLWATISSTSLTR